MGFDISNHAVDTRLMSQTLIPALQSGVSPTAFLERAAGLCAIASRANQWGLRVVGLDHLISDKQREVGSERTVRRPKKVSLLRRLLGGAAFEEVTLPAKTSGLPGFNSDLCVWGRPFFIVAETVEESLDGFERYMQCAPGDLSSVDALARSMLAKLESLRHRLPCDLTPAVAAVLDAFYPIEAHLPPLSSDDAREVSVAATNARLASSFAMYSAGWAKRESDDVIEDDSLDEPVEAAELALSAPYALMNFAAQGLPGWMGRGRVWPTMLFEKIGVSVSHVFETPVALFEPLVREHPELEERFADTITENFTLGGYVRPGNVGALRALLQKHERELVLAWCDDKDVPPEEFESLSSDYIKILEPVTLAERKGYGFIEAAEVYSGFMGVMN